MNRKLADVTAIHMDPESGLYARYLAPDSVDDTSHHIFVAGSLLLKVAGRHNADVEAVSSSLDQIQASCNMFFCGSEVHAHWRAYLIRCHMHILKYNTALSPWHRLYFYIAV
jgi:hypothetical protein